MKDLMKFVIQVAVLIFVIWLLAKYTTLDDRIISFFHENSSLSGNVASNGNGGVNNGSNNGNNNGGSQVVGSSCITPWGEMVNHGAYIIAYESTSSCRFEKRYCADGLLQGSYTADHCNSGGGNAYATSTPQVVTVNYGYVQAIPQEGNYEAPSRTSANGITTVINSWNNQKSNPTTIYAHDSSYIKPVPYKNYDLTQRGCTTPWGTFVNNGSSVVAYKYSKPTSKGGSCAYERRTCFQGTLGGSFVYPSCSIADNSHIYDNYGQDYFYPVKYRDYSCTTPWGSTIANGRSVTAYKSSYGPCYSQTRTCNNGYLNGSYQYSYCSNYRDDRDYCDDGRCDDHNKRCSLPRGGSIADGASVTAYSSSSSPCYSQTRTCNNGYLNGSYQHASCTTVTHENKCTTPWGQTLREGEKVEAYKTSSFPCYKEVRTCRSNGFLDGSFQYNYCNPGSTEGGEDTYSARTSVGEREGNIDSSDTCNANATSPYVCGSESSNSCTDYAKISCSSFSPMICTYQTRTVSCKR